VAAGSRFLLESESHTIYTDAANARKFIAYHYDSDGNRVSRSTFDGVDGSDILMSTMAYGYDADNRCTGRFLCDRAGDTIAIVRYVYDVDGVVSVRTLGGDHTVRFRDTLIYEEGLLVEKRRHNGSDDILFFHRYGYAGDTLRSDSLYEPDGETYTARQVRMPAYNPDGTVESEQHWILSDGRWYCVSTTLMAYESDNLVSAATYETDGTTKRLMDSLAYAYDDHGNRVLEEHFDAQGDKTYDIAYNWLDTQPVIIAAALHRVQRSVRIVCRNGRIEIGTPVNATVRLFRPDGRMLLRERVHGQSSLALPVGVTPGRYVLRITGETNTILPISIAN
jgi:hypothetical protein